MPGSCSMSDGSAPECGDLLVSEGNHRDISPTVDVGVVIATLYITYVATRHSSRVSPLFRKKQIATNINCRVAQSKGQHRVGKSYDFWIIC